MALLPALAAVVALLVDLLAALGWTVAIGALTVGASGSGVLGFVGGISACFTGVGGGVCSGGLVAFTGGAVAAVLDAFARCVGGGA